MLWWFHESGGWVCSCSSGCACDIGLLCFLLEAFASKLPTTICQATNIVYRKKELQIIIIRVCMMDGWMDKMRTWTGEAAMSKPATPPPMICPSDLANVTLNPPLRLLSPSSSQIVYDPIRLKISKRPYIITTWTQFSCFKKPNCQD